jgi:HD-GYP domain-containing protein (c-di-GMP phosphodiesterase class II)
VSSRPKSHRVGILVVAVLAGLSVRLDELYYRVPFSDWNWPDWIVGALLMISAAVAVSGALRLVESRGHIAERARRSSGLADAAWVVSRGGHTESVLTEVAEHACEILSVERATISVRESHDPRAYRVVAGHGLNGGVVGEQFGIDEGVLGQVFMTGEPVLVSPTDPAFRDGAGHEGTGTARAGGAAPIRWKGEVRGALWVGTSNPDRTFAQADLDSLCRLASLGGVALEQADMREHLELAVGSGVEALTEAIDMRDNYTWQHSKNVMHLSAAVAKRMGLDDASTAELALAARLHDVGKVALPDYILLKSAPLTPDEWEIMKQYPLRGAEMLERVPGLATVSEIVLCEQEHWDGGGYPRGLSGPEIPLASRIILACDAYDAMVSDRPWRSALKPWAAAKEMRSGAGKQFDPQVIVQLIGVLRDARATSPLGMLWAAREQQSASDGATA